MQTALFRAVLPSVRWMTPACRFAMSIKPPSQKQQVNRVAGTLVCSRNSSMANNEQELNKVTEADQIQKEDSSREEESSKTDYRYFKALQQLKNFDSKDLTGSFKAQISVEGENQQKDVTTAVDVDLYKGIDIENIKPALPKKSFSLASYVSKSETLSKLVQLGVDLSLVEKNKSAANHILKLDFEKDVEPYLMFFHNMAISDRNVPKVISKNPGIFTASLEDLEAKIKYLESKKFSKVDVARIVAKAPLILTQSTVHIDTQLGYLQREFQLTGDEVRTAVLSCPKLTTWSRQGIKQMKFSLVEFMGFTGDETKQLMLEYPKLYTCHEQSVLQCFQYLHNVMGYSHAQVLLWPNVLRTRKRVLLQRHQFLKHLDRNQYDPQKENFVSTHALTTGSDAAFCKNVAKVAVKDYNDFMKTL